MHTLELRAEYEERLGVILDLEAEERDRVDAERWIRWYEQPERRLMDLGDDVELMAFNKPVPSSALRRLATRPET